MIDRPTIAKIMDATKIEEVVSEFVTLKKRGINYVGLCPFHNDSNPSFSVSPTRGICHCFTCGKGGNAINFLMELEQMTYPDALRWLAKKYKIEIQERELTNEEKQRESERESMFIVNDWAAKYFQDILLHDVDGIAIGMAYFRGRGFRDDIIRKFQLGFALPKRTALAEAAKAAGYNPKYLVDTGLCFKVDKDEAGNKSGEDKILDRFSGRAIFPWFSVSGKVVAFGGRVLDSRTKGISQKYVNSPDSVIYHKERELYGLYQAKKAMSEEADTKLMTNIINDQRKIIADVTGKKASETPQVWALYKEVLDYYDKGMKVPDDVTLLLCDDNWGNVRRVPNAKERKHKGGWGLYYHVDYVGAPRNSKMLNVTPVQNPWEQLTLAYENGIDRLWILNVGALHALGVWHKRHSGKALAHERNLDPLGALLLLALRSSIGFRCEERCFDFHHTVVFGDNGSLGS
jgi:hypothetical protein